ncbi:MAG: hypothetical protein NTZ50_09515 [Chloroflexi bacterium]|nr:hypothetical protein [Chloroflexota bacterium]
MLNMQPADVYAAGVDLYVDSAGTNSGNCTSSGSPCLTIAYAVSQSAVGHVIHLAAGTYTGNSTVTPALHFIGACEGATIIDGGGTMRMFNMTSNTAGVTCVGAIYDSSGSDSSCITGTPMLHNLAFDAAAIYWRSSGNSVLQNALLADNRTIVPNNNTD